MDDNDIKVPYPVASCFIASRNAAAAAAAAQALAATTAQAAATAKAEAERLAAEAVGFVKVGRGGKPASDKAAEQ